MITPILERLLLRGDANYTTHSHAFGMLGRIPCQRGKIAIIEKIIWHPFVNSVIDAGGFGMTWATFFQYSEYQLKVDGFKSVNYYQFRNEIDFVLTDPVNHPIDMQGLVDANSLRYLNLQPKPPVIVDTFLVCSDVIKITISRNAMIFGTADTMGLLNNSANEKPTPNGVQNAQVLRQELLSNWTGNLQYYYPAGNQFSGIPATQPRNTEQYTQDIYNRDGAGAQANSTISPINGTPIGGRPYITHPLVTFGIVYVNENIASQLMSTT